MFKGRQSSKIGISSRAGLALMTVVLLLSFGLSAPGLNAQPIWTDELYSVFNMGAFDGPYSPAQIVQSVAGHFPDHVPLFFLLGAGWAHLVGWSQFALRLFSVLSGVLTIAWLYRLGTDVFNRRAGLMGSLLLGTSAYVLLHFHNFRMYPLLLLLAVMHSWFYWRLAHNFRTTRLTWLLFTLTAVLLLYTHNFAIILFAGLGFYHLVFVSRSRRWFHVLLGWGVGALCFLPYLNVLISGVRRAPEMDDVTSAAASPGELMRIFFDLLGNGSVDLTSVFGGVLILAVWRRRDAVIVKFMLMSLVMLTLIILLNEAIGLIPIDRMRYFLILWVPGMLLFGCGLSWVPRWLAVLCLLLWGIAGWQFYRSVDIRGYIGGMAYSYEYPPLQDYAHHLEGKVRSGDYLLGFTPSGEVNKIHELGKSVADFYTELHLGIDGGFILRRGFGEWLEENIRHQMTGSPYLLFAYDPQDKPKTFDRVMDEIAADYVACGIVLDEPNLFARRYVNPVIGCEREEYAPIAYENEVRVIDRAARYVPESNLVQILTWWEVEDEQLLYEYNVSMQIITPDWQNVRQEDRHLYELPPWNVIELSTADLPPGDYRLMIILYHRDTGEKVSGADSITGETAKIWPILSFTIESDS